MSVFEYKVIPAPTSGKKVKGSKGRESRFANSLSEKINQLATEGWQYMRAESLPSVERVGITRKRVETYQNVLVFCRPTDEEPVETQEPKRKLDGFNPFKRFSASAVAEPVLTSPSENDVSEIEEEVEAEAEIDEETEDEELEETEDEKA